MWNRLDYVKTNEPHPDNPATTVKGWRPSSMTPEVIQKLEFAFSQFYNDIEACKYAWIGTSTLYNHQDKNPEFLERKKLLRSNPSIIAKNRVIKEMKSDKSHVSLHQRWLKHANKEEFGDKLDLKQDIDQNITITMFGQGENQEIIDANELDKKQIVDQTTTSDSEPF